MIKEVSFCDIIEDMLPLLAEHIKEVGKSSELISVDPDQEAYKNAENNNMLLSLGAFSDNKLIGYSLTFIIKSPHTQGLIIANNDVIFVKKEYRNSRTGLNLFKKTEELSKKHGAKLIIWNAKEASTLAKLLFRWDYNIESISFSREL